ncbi:MAG: Crp/Fnr family transcriptional regulator [Pseudolabrys sp.]|nr:Crp/Fnr family transcriptional regulator [Pseudolabrys sp.]
MRMADHRLTAVPLAVASGFTTDSGIPTRASCSCSFCPLNDGSLCAAATSATGPCEASRGGVSSLKATEHTVPARRLVWHPKEWSEYVPVITRGWAASSITLASGGRQILSFLLPGDLVSTASLFGAVSGRSIEAITEVTFRKYRRDDISALLRSDSDFFERVSAACIHERVHADNLLVDLGRRMADARIGRLVLYLAEALDKRDMVKFQTMPFPLRQRHIADATGLTTNHVTKTLTQFHRLGLIEISNRSLTITNIAELRTIAAWR